MKRQNKGFTLVEIIVVVSIFTILLGIGSLSLNGILGFRAQRAANSIGAALDKTKMEAMSRLAGEMKLEKTEDGTYISYYLHRGGDGEIKEEDRERIAPANTLISYKTRSSTGIESEEISLDKGTSIILTYDRETGGFRPIQSQVVENPDMWRELQSRHDVSFHDTDNYCSQIMVRGGFRTRILTLDINSGSYEITAG